jgi:predicted dehydrogenase
MSQIRLGLIGCGFVGRLHAQRLLADPRGQIVVYCDPNPQAAEALATECTPGAAVEIDPIAAMGRHRLDAVVICSPTPLHYQQVCTAFDHGLDVLCEKPLCSGREQILDLIERHRQQGRILSISYQRRYKSIYLTARRELTENAAYYPLKQVHIFVCERWHQGITGTWRDDPNVGAGYFGDAGSHQVDVVHSVTGQQVDALFATSDKRGSRVEIVTQVMAALSGGAGLNAHFVGDANHWREDIHFHCQNADLMVRGEQLWRAKDNRVELVPDPLPEGSPDSTFLDAILSRQPTISPAEAALPLYDWTAGVLESAREGRRVTLPRPVVD